jgi:hypothetical protein
MTFLLITFLLITLLLITFLNITCCLFTLVQGSFRGRDVARVQDQPDPRVPARQRTPCRGRRERQAKSVETRGLHLLNGSFSGKIFTGSRFWEKAYETNYRHMSISRKTLPDLKPVIGMSAYHS